MTMMESPSRNPSTPEVVIVGAGLAGLACGRVLHRAGVHFRIYEAADAPGGRVRTDEVDGFLLDRGFQVMLPAYPEARRVLDYDELDLRRFYRGADAMLVDGPQRFADPLYHPWVTLRSLRHSLATWRDRWLLVLLRKESLGMTSVPYGKTAMETEDFLRRFGYSDRFVNGFFRPFFGGIFLEKDLRTSSAMFQFLFAMFARQGAALPAHGMESIPRQLASRLPLGSVEYQRPVKSVGPGQIELADGSRVSASHVVLAVSETAAFQLLPSEWKPERQPRVRSVTCLYFGSHQRPCRDGILMLDSAGRGPVNNACVISNVSPHYAPEGQHLISASVLGTAKGMDLEKEVREQMVRWFGPQARDWRHLRTYRIEEAQSEDRQKMVGAGPLDVQITEGLYRAGDYCEDVSINGALLSGRKAAEAVLIKMGR